MKKFRKLALYIAMGALVLGAAGCKKEEEVTTTEATTTEATTEATTEDLHPGQVQHPLNGAWVTEEEANKRPISVMINNIISSIPQSGIEKADIIYEVLVEGGITRLMAVYSDYSDLDKIGSIRSARHYYAKLAKEYDSIYVHVGHSKYATKEFEKNPMDHIDGVEGIGSVFTYRDPSKVAPHNCYASTDGINKAFEQKGFQLTHHDTYDSEKFLFNDGDLDLTDGTAANKITTKYSNNRQPYFEYNATDKLYYRYQYNDAHIDESTGNQLAFKNVIIQFCKHTVIDEKHDMQDIKFRGTGEGWYATNGKIIPITWEKETDGSVTKYYTLDGEQLKMNPGKTFITIFKKGQKESIIVE